MLSQKNISHCSKITCWLMYGRKISRKGSVLIVVTFGWTLIQFHSPNLNWVIIRSFDELTVRGKSNTALDYLIVFHVATRPPVAYHMSSANHNCTLAFLYVYQCVGVQVSQVLITEHWLEKAYYLYAPTHFPIAL